MAHNAMVKSYRGTATFLEFKQSLDLIKLPEWNYALQRMFDDGECEALSWGHMLEQPERVIILAEWPTSSSEQQKHAATAALGSISTLLKSEAQWEEVPFMFRQFDPDHDKIYELINIHGDPAQVTSELLEKVELLVNQTTPLLGHEIPTHLMGCTRGMRDVLNDDGTRTIGTLWVWESMEHRSAFVDPTQDSPSIKTMYDDKFASALRNLETRGAVINRYIFTLQCWRPPPASEKRERCCTIL